MGITVSNAFIQEYEDNVRHLSQQSETRLRPHVTEVSSSGESYNFDRLASTDAVQKVGRRQATNYVDDTWSRRVAQPQTFNHTMTIEHEDKVQMLINPESAYATNQAMAMRRSQDSLIIAAATADALDGDGALVPLPAASIVGDGTAPISFDIVTEVQENFMIQEVMPDEPKVMFVSPVQVRKLMQLTENTSSDYVQAQALQQYGIVPNWLGFTWIVSNLLESPGAGEIDCLAFTKKAIGLAVNMNTMTRIGEDPSMSYMIQVFSQWTMGAVRVEDEHICRVHLLDSL